MTQHDLIIIGGGVVGAGLALGLRHSGMNIALIDARTPSNNDPRLFALNTGSCQFLKNIGIWSSLETYATSIHEVHVSRKGRFGSVHLSHHDVGLSTLGYVVPAKHIEAAMNERLTDVHVYRPATLMNITQQDSKMQLTISSKIGESQLCAPLVIGADGTDSTVRNLLKIESEVFDYGQTAIVTISDIARSHQHIAYERFINQGAIAMLPLPNNTCATIVSVNNALASELLTLDDANFKQWLQTHFGYKLGRITKVSQRHSYPLRMVKAKKNVEKSVFLLGNSAHTLHPIAAQGFNLALYEVATLIEGIRKTPSLSVADLANINQQTIKQQTIGTQFSHRLAQLFTKDSFFSDLAIHLGMAGLDLIAPAKRSFLNNLMGRNGTVPRLLLGGTYEKDVQGGH